MALVISVNDVFFKCIFVNDVFIVIIFVLFFSKAERARPYLQTMESHVREQGTDFINAVFVDVSMMCLRKINLK